MKIILISGKAFAGKDTFALELKKQLEKKNQKVLICHYADLLKYICKTFFEWDGIKNEFGRDLLQRVGTDEIRKKCPNYWVDFIVDILKIYENSWDYVIIPDCRFKSEIERIVDAGFVSETIRIYRPEFITSLTQDQENHPSETDLDDFDFDNMFVIKEGYENVKRGVEFFLKCKTLFKERN